MPAGTSGHAGSKGTPRVKKTIQKLLGLGKGSHSQMDRPSSGRASVSKDAGSRDGQHTIEESSDNGTRRQLVQMLLREGLRRHGIPLGWVECQMLVVQSRSRGPGMYVRLVMRHWDPRLVNYAYAFQKDLLEAITRFEPQAGIWLHGISWEFNVEDSCPYPEMPDPSVWLEPPAATAPAAATSPVSQAAAGAAVANAAQHADDEVLRDLKDLQSMFATRDAVLEEKAKAEAPPDFLPTQPSGLN